MKILVINYEYPPLGGGGGFVTRDIFENIAAKGHDITVITSHFKNLPKFEESNGVKILRTSVLFRNKIEVANLPSMLTYVPSSILTALKNFKKNNFDIINTHFAIPSGPAGYVLAKHWSLPNILSIHGGDIYDPSKSLSPHRIPILSHTVKKMLTSASSVIAQSSDTKQRAATIYDFNGLMNIIPLGIPKPTYIKRSRQEFDLTNEDIVICTIGRLVKRKNIKEALSILSTFTGNEKFKFLVIGDGPNRSELQQYVTENGLDRIVRFLGNVSDEEKFQLLFLSDIYMSTALHEGFGLVFLEAMECELPIISYDNGGQKDFLVNEQTGYLVPAFDKEKFANCLKRLIENPTERKRFGDFNKNLVSNYYIDNCAEKYIQNFTETIHRHRT